MRNSCDTFGISKSPFDFKSLNEFEQSLKGLNKIENRNPNLF